MHRLRKQSRLLCGHCNEYLSRTAFWKHRQLYYDVHNESWRRKDDAEEFKQEVEPALRGASAAGFTAENTNIFSSDSSGEDDLERAAACEDELRVLIDCYKTMYPREKIELTSSVARKYSSIMLGTEKFGSKMDCRNLRSARVMASWSTDDGCIDISAPSRPGIVNSYILHSVKINGEFYQHVFAIVWWYKADCDESYFGKPAQVWKLYNYEPCGPALFMPVQRIRKKYAFSSVTLNGVKKLVSSPIPRVFH